jgi:hypothetical protein
MLRQMTLYPQTLLLLLAILALGACASAKPDIRAEVLDIDVAAYYDHLRWGHYEEATAFQSLPAGQEASTDQLELLAHFHISSYELLSRTVSADKNAARIAVRLDYYDDQNGTAQTVREERTWIYVPTTKHWKIEAGFPEFHSEPSR